MILSISRHTQCSLGLLETQETEQKCCKVLKKKKSSPGQLLSMANQAWNIWVLVLLITSPYPLPISTALSLHNPSPSSLLTVHRVSPFSPSSLSSQPSTCPGSCPLFALLSMYIFLFQQALTTQLSHGTMPTVGNGTTWAAVLQEYRHMLYF